MRDLLIFNIFFLILLRKKKSLSKSKGKKIDEFILLQKGYQIIFAQFNIKQNIKIYHASNQILHKSQLYIHLDNLNSRIQNKFMKIISDLTIDNDDYGQKVIIF